MVFLNNSCQDKQLYPVLFCCFETSLSWELYNLSPDCCCPPLTGWQRSIDPSWEDVMNWQQWGLLFAYLRKYQKAVLANLSCLRRKKMWIEQWEECAWLLIPLLLGKGCAGIKVGLLRVKALQFVAVLWSYATGLSEALGGYPCNPNQLQKSCFAQRVHRTSCPPFNISHKTLQTFRENVHCRKQKRRKIITTINRKVLLFVIGKSTRWIKRKKGGVWGY